MKQSWGYGYVNNVYDSKKHQRKEYTESDEEANTSKIECAITLYTPERIITNCRGIPFVTLIAKYTFSMITA